MNRLFNLTLRATTLASKFLLLFFLARLLTPDAVGLYGLTVATITYCLYIVGLEFYTFSTRELLRKNRNEWGQMIKSQIIFLIISYLFFSIGFYFIFEREILPKSLALWFYVLLALELMAQELNRLLVTVSQQLNASIVLFLRAGLWVFIVIGLMYSNDYYKDLIYVFLFWVLGNLIAILYGSFVFIRQKPEGWRKKTDWSWIIRGIKTAFPLLLATLSIRGIYTLDKYWFEHLTSLEILGAYILFIGMTNALLSFLDAAVFMYTYPTLIGAFNSGSKRAFTEELKKTTFYTVFICLIFTLCSFFVLPIITTWLGDSVYSNNIGLFWSLLLATFIFCLGHIPQYILYSTGNDRPIFQSHVLGFIIFVISTFLAMQFTYLYAIPIGLNTAFTLILFWKSYFSLKQLSDPNTFIKVNN